MKAIVIATGINSDLFALNEQYPIELVPLLTRPFIQYVIEYLVGNGIFEVEFILSYMPEKIEAFIGDGSRWGATVNFHLCRDETTPYRKLKEICSNFTPDEQFLLAHGDRLPQFQLASVDKPTLFFNEDGSQWSGWALFSYRNIVGLPKNADEEVLRTHSILVEKCSIQQVPAMLSLRSYESLLQSQRALMAKEFSGLLPSGKETSEGIWLAENLTLDPTVKLSAPVFIGENCRIGMGAHLGPSAIIGNDCILGSKSSVTNSIIFSGSFIGEALELSGAIVDKNRLINTNLGVAVSVTDEFILGNINKRPFKNRLMNLISRVTAIFLLLLTSPLLLFIILWLKLTRGIALYKHDAVKLPAPTDANSWKSMQIYSFISPFDEKLSNERGLSDLFMNFLPALINIAKGELHFVGVRPLPKHRINMLPNDWQALYLNSKVGVVTEAFILYGNDPTTDEICSAESFYSVMSGFTYDLKLMLRYLSRITKLSPTPTNKKTRLQE